jgi:hypothetical protein
MPYRTAVRSDGCIPLGDAAARLGFRPGVLVDVIVTRAGSLILAINEDVPTYDATWKPLVGTAARKALAAGRDRRVTP